MILTRIYNSISSHSWGSCEGLDLKCFVVGIDGNRTHGDQPVRSLNQSDPINIHDIHVRLKKKVSITFGTAVGTKNATDLWTRHYSVNVISKFTAQVVTVTGIS